MKFDFFIIAYTTNDDVYYIDMSFCNVDVNNYYCQFLEMKMISLEKEIKKYQWYQTNQYIM